MFEFKSKLYTVLAANAPFRNLIASVPGTNRPAIYLNHISQFENVAYPAVSFFFEGGGADHSVQIAEASTLVFSIWTEEREQPGSPLALGLSGAWKIYRAAKPLFHKAHMGFGLHDSAYKLGYCAEMPGHIMEQFDRNLKLYHLQTRIAVMLLPTGAELAYPT